MLPLSPGLFDNINAPKALLPLKGFKPTRGGFGSPLVINADPGVAYCVAKGVLTQSPAQPLNPDLDLEFDCDGVDANGDPQHGVSLVLAFGDIPFVNFITTGTSQVNAYGSPIFGNVFAGTATALIKAYGDLLLEGSRINWVKWSNIGSLNFVIGKDNVAGERPLDWKGQVHAIKKLAGKAVAYGENGVSILQPAGTTYGLNTIYRIGLKAKNAVTGDDTIHFFIDKIGQLFKLGESLERVDYSEYLSALDSNTVMSYDVLNNLIYICDGTLGFVYNPLVGSLGKCPPNVTGIGSQSGTLYVVSPDVITSLPFEICTDVYNFGTSAYKSITSVEVETEATVPLYTAIDYKRNIAGSFVRTPWIRFQQRGLAFINAFGTDFRIRVKADTYEWFTVNLKINGFVHNN